MTRTDFANYKVTVASDASGLRDNVYAPGATFTLSGDITLTAMWTPVKYTVNLYTNKPLTSSSSMTHADPLTTDNGIELKDATADQIEASGIGNFGFVASTYYAKGTTFNTCIQKGCNMKEKLTTNKKAIVIDEIICEYKNEFCVKGSKKLKQEYKVWKNNLTKEEIGALKRYRLGTVTPGKTNINAYLRNGKENDKEKNREVMLLNNALEKASVKENIVTCRRITGKEYEFIKRFQVGDEFTNKDFKGTHVWKKLYKSTSAAYIIYLIPKGYKCAYINFWIHIFDFEKELLLNCGSKCVVLEIKKIFNRDCYILKLIS